MKLNRTYLAFAYCRVYRVRYLFQNIKKCLGQSLVTLPSYFQVDWPMKRQGNRRSTSLFPRLDVQSKSVSLINRADLWRLETHRNRAGDRRGSSAARGETPARFSSFLEYLRFSTLAVTALSGTFRSISTVVVGKYSFPSGVMLDDGCATRVKRRFTSSNALCEGVSRIVISLLNSARKRFISVICGMRSSRSKAKLIKRIRKCKYEY